MTYDPDAISGHGAVLRPGEQRMLDAEMDRTRELAADLQPATHEHRRERMYPLSAPDGLPVPDWLMFGVPRPDGTFRLYACKDVSQADLRVSVGDALANGPAQIVVQATMGPTLIIDRPTYGECLAAMAQIWRNWQAGGREITGG